ncbi:MAG: hypothetical protein FWC40_07390 [Proteobacteria bacterium]|nr:hypothetical protein [Pseudomonadota bacterium]
MKKYLLIASMLTCFISGQAHADRYAYSAYVEWQGKTAEVSGVVAYREHAINHALNDGCAELCGNDKKCMQGCKTSANTHITSTSSSCDLVVRYQGNSANVKVNGEGENLCMKRMTNSECKALISPKSNNNNTSLVFQLQQMSCSEFMANAKSIACRKVHLDANYVRICQSDCARHHENCTRNDHCKNDKTECEKRKAHCEIKGVTCQTCHTDSGKERCKKSTFDCERDYGDCCKKHSDNCKNCENIHETCLARCRPDDESFLTECQTNAEVFISEEFGDEPGVVVRYQGRSYNIKVENQAGRACHRLLSPDKTPSPHHGRFVALCPKLEIQAKREACQKLCKDAQCQADCEINAIIAQSPCSFNSLTSRFTGTNEGWYDAGRNPPLLTCGIP